MIVEITPNAWDELMYWKSVDQETFDKIIELIKDIRKTPFRGLGKPDPLKLQLKGFWSRRINQEHRLVYQVGGKKGNDQKCSIIQCRFHY